MAAITSSLGSTSTRNPYDPAPPLDFGGGLNIAGLIRALAKRGAGGGTIIGPAGTGGSTRGGVYGPQPKSPLEMARENYEIAKMRADLEGPQTNLVPTGYGHMLQADYGSLPWSMQPKNAQVVPDNAPAAEASGTGQSYEDWKAANEARLAGVGSGNLQTLAEMVRSGRS